MPFLGKDWRSQGDQWIRTEFGWDRTKALEGILDNLSIGLKNEKKMYNKKKHFSNLNMLNEEQKNESGTITTKSNSQSNDDSYDDDFDMSTDDDCDYDDDVYNNDNFEENKKDEMCDENPGGKLKEKKYNSLRRLCLSNGSIERYNYKTRQPHIIFYDFEATNRENNAPKATISDVLNALDMPGAVRDIKRFNYVCKLVQIIINEKLHHLSGNAQRTLFMIVKQMLIQVIKTQENLNVMRKLLFDFKKKIQDSYFYYFYYVGSQKLANKHLATINKWQEMLDNPNNKRVKRLTSHNLDTIPLDCKIEIMRRLNTGLDLINLSKCNKNLNDIITKELAIWKKLCQFHFQQASINVFLNKANKSQQQNQQQQNEMNGQNEMDWKKIYFNMKRRYGHREIYVDMIYKCVYCKCLFWKEIGHPCKIADCMNENDSLSENDTLDIKAEPITPKKLIDLLTK